MYSFLVNVCFGQGIDSVLSWIFTCFTTAYSFFTAILNILTKTAAFCKQNYITRSVLCDCELRDNAIYQSLESRIIFDCHMEQSFFLFIACITHSQIVCRQISSPNFAKNCILVVFCFVRVYVILQLFDQFQNFPL